MRYIELNLVRALMVDYPGEYIWSSYQHNAHGVSDALVTSHFLYDELGASKEVRQIAY